MTKTAKHLVVGAGPVGTETARLLAEAGHEVVVVTRSGARPDISGVGKVAADASDANTLTSLSLGATALYNCANPADYTIWERVWPPLAESLLTAAESSGATLVTASSLYGYGPCSEPMVEGQADRATDRKGRIRADMWVEARSRHHVGRVRAVEVRGSDYVGAGVGSNGHIPRQLPTARKGRTAWVMGSPDQPHTWTDVIDMARTLVAVAGREDSWGQVWHAPSNPPRTQREALTDVLAAEGKPAVAVRSYPRLVTAVGGRVSRLMRELNEMAYMFERPYEMSSSRTQEFLGMAPTPWPEVCRRTADGN
ncbi:MAG: Nucleoside-diphosphate-sugar epimerases [uncultured Propionibacteriaceae bacterium]|uniref:Nucleoside-diphosphate-sugar epimerases n=1 Tax=uncultured Propionibacteriaceae bacterium TaxID=257457 RepID=A0A6J4ND89_9ACTN|nr:MAG: Nucleoside-diphosphate-sugar epimerases [uncultured Propionibacteriaceae bacterium]